jgi:hypothetical protein
MLKTNSGFANELMEMCEADTEIHGLVIQLMLVLDYESGRRLDDLRDERNISDYELSASGPMDIERAGRAIERGAFIGSRTLPDEDKIDAKIAKVTEIVMNFYAKYRRRRYHE